MLNPKTRISDLSRLGFSPPILELSSGRKPHPIFEDICNDPYYIYHGGTTPFNLTIIPIWEEGMTLTAVLENQERNEIIEFSLESPDEFTAIAYCEQGLWANLFASFIDDWKRPEYNLDTVKDAAGVVSFLFLKETIAFVQENRGSENYTELLNEFTKSI
jgi:hypothetical protein